MAAVCMLLSQLGRWIDRSKSRYRAAAEGRVVRIETEPADARENRTEFHDRQYAVIEFFAGGRLVEVRGPVSAYPSPYHTGQRLHLSYDPQDPSRYQIVTDHRWNILARIACGAAVFLVAAGCLFFLLFATRTEL
jgi:hypothetical protein